MTFLHSIAEAARRERDGSSRQRALLLYHRACSTLDVLLADLVLIGDWIKYRADDGPEDLIGAFARWMLTRDACDELVDEPIDIPPTEEGAYRSGGVFSLSSIRERLSNAEGFLIAADAHAPKRFEEVLSS